MLADILLKEEEEAGFYYDALILQCRGVGMQWGREPQRPDCNLHGPGWPRGEAIIDQGQHL